MWRRVHRVNRRFGESIAIAFSRWFLDRGYFIPWRWRRRSPETSVYTICTICTSQKASFFIVTAVKTSHPISFRAFRFPFPLSYSSLFIPMQGKPKITHFPYFGRTNRSRLMIRPCSLCAYLSQTSEHLNRSLGNLVCSLCQQRPSQRRTSQSPTVSNTNIRSSKVS
jgi:hypothetical protein